MIPIITLTLNPALDISASAPLVQAGPKLRLADPQVEPGGGGLNVARAIRALGGQAVAMAALGGANGGRLAALVEEQGIDLVRFATSGETRESLAVTENGTGQQFRFVLPGPTWSTGMTQRFLGELTDLLDQRSGRDAFVVLSGSQPAGMPAEFARDLCAAVAPARVIVDTSGPALADLVAPGKAEGTARPFVLRMDQSESEAAAGRALPTLMDSLAFARDLAARGVADVVVLAHGAEGSVLATPELALAAVPPQVPVASRVGAGDSFVAGLTLSLANGGSLTQALALGTAAAAAAVMTPGTQLCRRADVDTLLPRVRVTAGAL
ncbi:MAG: hexose kinase [Paracoccaceae bacterium]